MESTLKTGQRVVTGVWIGGEFRAGAAGLVVSVAPDHVDVDIMSFCGGAPWVLELRLDQVRPDAPVMYLRRRVFASATPLRLQARGPEGREVGLYVQGRAELPLLESDLGGWDAVPTGSGRAWTRKVERAILTWWDSGDAYLEMYDTDAAFEAAAGQLRAAPCALCGEDCPLSATSCPECGGNPATELVPCEECGGEGYLDRAVTIGTAYGPRPSPWEEERGTCHVCHGDREVEPRFTAERMRGLAQIQRLG